jgi:hypothetical protein
MSQDEKIAIIAKLFELELSNPETKSVRKTDAWYGEQFDKWYDVKLAALRHLLDIKIMKHRNE